MPSTIIGSMSGLAQIIVSGNPWSGYYVRPTGGVQLRLSREASGNVYVGFSGSITINSGSTFLSGGGVQDGMIMYPGDAYFIPKLELQQSGTYNIYVRHDAAASGQARLYYEFF